MDSVLNKFKRNEKNRVEKDTITGHQKHSNSLNAYDKSNFDYSRIDDVTIEEVKQFEKFKSLTDDQATKIIENIKSYVAIIYNLCSNHQNRGIRPFDNEK